MKRERMRGWVGTLLAVWVAVAIFGWDVGTATAHRDKPDPKVVIRLDMNRLWVDHAVWTRAYLLASLADSAEKPEILQRLLRNADDIGNALSYFYGLEATKNLSEILKNHFRLTAEMIEAAKSGEEGRLRETEKKAHVTAEEIAAFLKKANPDWSQETILSLLKRDLSLSIDAIQARLQGRWKDDIAAFDRDLQVTTMLADILAEGIVKQFPGKLS